MRLPLRLGYEALTQVARGAAAVAPPGGSKLLQSLRGRRGIRARYRQWGAAGRDLARPLLWMHASSVGEGLQARPVLQRLRRERPDVQIAFTHFSSSASAFAAGLDVDFRDYLPFDTRADAVVALEALRPTALVFSKLDLWPMITRTARERGARLGLISATITHASGRRSALGRAFLREAYSLLDAVGAIDERDAVRLGQLGVRPDAIAVTGDTRYDQVWERAQGVHDDHALIDPLRAERPTLVAGSTWPADEAVLLPAFLEARRRVPGLRMIIAPHEPTPQHLAPLEAWAQAAEVALARLGAAEASRADVVLVDRVGALGALYALGDIAFVGGGFHRAGLHSVLEPAAFGSPVLFGPLHDRSRDAGLLLERGGAMATAGTDALIAALARWCRDEPSRREAGDRARKLVHDGLGAAERSVRLVQRLLA